MTELPYVAHVRPAMSIEKGITVMLPEELYNGTVDQIIHYSLEKPDIRADEQRVADRIRHEMRDNTYTVTLNNNPVERDERVGNLYENQSYFDQEAGESYEYHKLDLVVTYKIWDGGLEKKL